MSCDTCPVPGNCCRFFELQGGEFAVGKSYLETLVLLATRFVPFMPLVRSPIFKGWRFWCPNLGRDGRCTDYENRPDTCRKYEVGSDPLCVLHVPAPAADAPKDTET